MDRPEASAEQLHRISLLPVCQSCNASAPVGQLATASSISAL
ncbi:hypothetical protein HMPREF0591_4398 [Mycobacterium parascrofulaceum ATCC BAA-614]|uniref:Uncharacterized protein n=1 Tax=Mycobacterium parascrofulaceum ATCC BAA-614 TaxID=525368 RepID=D5PE04_9MYCO|nr:hypothetical protein HMPREF0591_4398 [Mycobacterium parascrofulaceum ATCC BAA-614]ETZ27093.1 hypothetical protein L843_5605 [Mycobacterium intracellulare MIN_061107_1834]ETZ44627.1 hypothetical protein L839_3410 [Mycobacterium avium MAV_120809_2495]ETZ54984.1 hypothetical protein L840_4217 [Mycobacterium sp. MAC_011194_8550]